MLVRAKIWIGIYEHPSVAHHIGSTAVCALLIAGIDRVRGLLPDSERRFLHRARLLIGGRQVLL